LRVGRVDAFIEDSGWESAGKQECECCRPESHPAPEPIDVSLEFPFGAADFLVTPLGADRYRLEEDPFYFAYVQVESLRELARLPRYGDEFEAVTVRHNELRFVKVVKRARLKRFEFLVSEVTVASPQFARVLSRVDQLNGYWERVFGGIVNIYVPRGSGYNPFERCRRRQSCGSSGRCSSVSGGGRERLHPPSRPRLRGQS
jgi:hypothetical protein